VESAPLPALPVATASWPAASLAGRLLLELGARLDNNAAVAGALRLGTHSVAAPASDAAEDWTGSPVATLTGRPGGPALVPQGAPATVARALGLAITALGGPLLDGAAVLGARVGLVPLRRRGTRSAAGAARLLRTADGWAALNLPRPSDLELVPPLIRGEPSGADPWSSIGTWARALEAAEVVERAALLGLAVARLGETRPPQVPWHLTPVPATLSTPVSASPDPTRLPRVINLGALWAGPLCAQTLRRTGWPVSDVTSSRRPDPTPAVLREVLHAGHREIVIDFGTPDGRRRLGELLASADVVIEASRPRALRQLGLDAATVMADGRRRTWVRITGHGPTCERIAFGDDAAVAGGLVARDHEGPVFAGDAIADPLTGLTGALLALACQRSRLGWIVDVPMAGVAAWAARPWANLAAYFASSNSLARNQM
jgi:hypothetical protein